MTGVGWERGDDDHDDDDDDGWERGDDDDHDDDDDDHDDDDSCKAVNILATCRERSAAALTAPNPPTRGRTDGLKAVTAGQCTICEPCSRVARPPTIR